MPLPTLKTSDPRVILETLARYKEIYSEWSINEKVAMDGVMGAAYAASADGAVWDDTWTHVATPPPSINPT